MGKCADVCRGTWMGCPVSAGVPRSIPFEDEGDRNSAQGLKNKSLGLWVGVVQPYQWSQSSYDRERRLVSISSRERIVRMSKGGRERGRRRRGRGEEGENSNDNNGIRMGQKSELRR